MALEMDSQNGRLDSINQVRVLLLFLYFQLYVHLQYHV